MVCGATLNCERKNVLSAILSLVLKALLILSELKCGLVCKLTVKLCYELSLCILLGKTCHSLECLDLRVKCGLNLCLECVGCLMLFGKQGFLLFERLELCIEGLFLLCYSSFKPGNLLATFFNVKVSLLFHLEYFFLRRNYRFLFSALGIFDSILENLSCLLFSRAKLLLSGHLSYKKSNHNAGNDAYRASNNC